MIPGVPVMRMQPAITWDRLRISVWSPLCRLRLQNRLMLPSPHTRSNPTVLKTYRPGFNRGCVFPKTQVKQRSSWLISCFFILGYMLMCVDFHAFERFREGYHKLCWSDEYSDLLHFNIARLDIIVNIITINSGLRLHHLTGKPIMIADK